MSDMNVSCPNCEENNAYFEIIDESGSHYCCPDCGYEWVDEDVKIENEDGNEGDKVRKLKIMLREMDKKDILFTYSQSGVNLIHNGEVIGKCKIFLDGDMDKVWHCANINLYEQIDNNLHLNYNLNSTVESDIFNLNSISLIEKSELSTDFLCSSSPLKNLRIF